MLYRFADSLRAGSGRSTCFGRRNCPKHVEFYSENKFEKLVHLAGFIIRFYHDARSPERPPPPKKKITRKLENKDSNTEASFEVTGPQEMKNECYFTIR